MKLLDVLRTNEPVIDRWTFVFDERNPHNGCYPMLATDDDGGMFSQWTEGYYEPDGDNSHLGNQVWLIGGTLLRHVMQRMAE